MFTGIVEEVGIIKKITESQISVECKKVLEDTKIGDSIAVNGVCQTVTEMSSNSFSAKVSDETMRVTNFSQSRQGSNVNLERALTLSSRLGGHIVSGHIDCMAKFVKFEPMTFELCADVEKYIVKKGSVTVNGVSLTVANITGKVFNIAIIPHTLAETNLQDLKIGDFVNIEVDVFAKYVEKILSGNDNKSNISNEFLMENGYV